MKSVLTMYNGSHEAVGFVFTLGDSPWGEPVLLTGLHIFEKYRGCGHAKALIRAITNQADREHKDLLLSVQPDPGTDFTRLAKLYESYGFRMLEDGTTMKRQCVALPKAAVHQDQL